MKDDRLISLNAAIDILEHKKDKNAKGDIGGFYNKIIQNDIDALMQLPPVQPSAADTNVATTDTISRQAAIKAADSIIERDTSGNNDVVKAMTAWKEYIKALPSAQQWTYVEVELPETIINEHTHDYQEYNCLCDFGDYGFDVRTFKFGNGHFWNGGGAVDKYVTA